MAQQAPPFSVELAAVRREWTKASEFQEYAGYLFSCIAPNDTPGIDVVLLDGAEVEKGAFFAGVQQCLSDGVFDSPVERESHNLSFLVVFNVLQIRTGAESTSVVFSRGTHQENADRRVVRQRYSHWELTSAIGAAGDDADAFLEKHLSPANRLRLDGKPAPETIGPGDIFRLCGIEDVHKILDFDDTIFLYEDGPQLIPSGFVQTDDKTMFYSRDLRGLSDYTILSANRDKRNIVDKLREAGAGEPHAVYYNIQPAQKKKHIEDIIMPDHVGKALHYFDDNLYATQCASDIEGISVYRVFDAKPPQPVQLRRRSSRTIKR